VLVDLVQTITRDGLRLDGILQAAPEGTVPSLPVAACCLLHGTGGNFYNSTLFDALAARLLELGCGVLRANTRGHDGISTAHTDRGGRRLGAAYEVVDDCRHDIAAWVGWLGRRTGSPIGLIGHSLGAVKALYALAREPELPVAALVAVSPPRLSHSWFAASPQGPEFLDTYARADRLVQLGQANALLEVQLPLPFVITAAGYVEKYGPDERYNYLRFVGDVRCPVLLTLGGIEVENNVAFRGAAEALRGMATPRLRVESIAGADHFYSCARKELVACMETWLRRLP
jgi:alpha-beta hydrolase superfamily lysophospholipase